MGRKKTQQQSIGGAGKAPRLFYSHLYTSLEDDDTKSGEEIKGEEFNIAFLKQWAGLRGAHGSDSTPDLPVATQQHSPAQGMIRSRTPLGTALNVSKTPPQDYREWDFSESLDQLIDRHIKLIDQLKRELATLETQRLEA